MKKRAPYRKVCFDPSGSIREMTRPLSARVMPRRALIPMTGQHHDYLSYGSALAQQRGMKARKKRH